MLWDIDLTLVNLTGIGGDWYGQALAEVTGTSLHTVPSFPGRTERWITTEVLTTHGVDATDEMVQRMWESLIDISTAAQATLPERGHALPGAARALTALADRDGVVQSLVTGNLPQIARHKLAAFDLHEHIDFDIGGYGSLSALRDELVGHAIARATSKHDMAPRSVAVVGDSPHDITAARKHDATAVGVTTGRHTDVELREAGAHTVLADLSDTPTVLAALLPPS